MFLSSVSCHDCLVFSVGAVVGLILLFTRCCFASSLVACLCKPTRLKKRKEWLEVRQAQAAILEEETEGEGGDACGIDPPLEISDGVSVLVQETKNPVEDPEKLSDHYEQRCPATGDLVGYVKRTDLREFPRIMKLARAAQQEWAKLSFEERGLHCMAMLDHLYAHRHEYAILLSKSTGKTLCCGSTAEIGAAMSCIGWYVNNTRKCLEDELLPPTIALLYNKWAVRTHEAVGVVGIFAPFNYPITIPFGEVIMGLMVGNAIMLKAATATIMTGRIIEEIVAAGNLPPYLFTHIVGPGGDISRACLDNGINKIFFTGSVPVGKSLAREAADSLTPLVLELGGHDPMIVCPDADLERASNGAIWAAFSNAGQTCAAVERCYVHEAVYDEFCSLIKKKVASMRHGIALSEEGEFVDGVHMGSMAKASQLNHVRAHLKDALDKGATILAQSKPKGDVSNGLFHPATVLVDLTPDMLCLQDETFGPLLRIVPVESVEEGVRLANDSNYALTASVWTTDSKKGKELARRVDGGCVTINDHVYTHGMANAEWGGWKDSGYGRTHGKSGLREMCNAKIVGMDILPSFMNRRNIFWHPYEKKIVTTMLDDFGSFLIGGVLKKVWVLLTLTPYLLKKTFTAWNPSDDDDEVVDSDN